MTMPHPWTDLERRVLEPLETPFLIQAFLDNLPYSTEPVYRCPRSVVRDRLAHCFDGAVFAAAALRRLGHPPRIVDLRAWRDDDHVLAVYRRDGFWGAVSKSNCAGLRLREPVFRNLRELVMSYFEFYFNVESAKSLRAYSVPLDLDAAYGAGWVIRDETMELIATRLDRLRHFSLLRPEMISALNPVDPRTYAAGMLGADERGLFRPAPEQPAPVTG